MLSAYHTYDDDKEFSTFVDLRVWSGRVLWSENMEWESVERESV